MGTSRGALQTTGLQTEQQLLSETYHGVDWNGGINPETAHHTTTKVMQTIMMELAV